MGFHHIYVIDVINIVATRNLKIIFSTTASHTNPKKMMLRIVVLVLIIVCADLAKGESKVPCYFIFGDSLSDVGNNNDLRTLAKTNYPPYGVDFPGGIATGRFSNNRTIEDFISKLTYLVS